jgi:hypothetical protein
MMFVGAHYKVEAMCKHTLRILLDMVQPPDLEIDSQLKPLIKERDVALSYFFNSFIKQTKTTIYESYGGFLGALVLKPAWA